MRALGATFPPDSLPYITLTSVLSQLGVEPTFMVLPLCPSCLEVFPGTTSSTSRCSRCDTPLFYSRRRLDRRTSGPETRRPAVQFPMKSIESQLRDILEVPGMEDELELWRQKPRTPGKLTDNFDGEVCKTLPAPDGSRFFENPPRHQELRIGLTLGADWFSYLRSHISPSHSSGPISFNVINFKEHLRFITISY
ncbi:hypothetical protein HGRIS_004324 [Hohenbuehelia grisea]|uniref:Uncharacterized protein n=1 Tax=Hohenbuehelia grisea TaxID=104357 RepID=A0ABR3IPE7_9AGAR